MEARTEVRLQLSPQEIVALAALAEGVAGICESPVTEEQAVVAALELALRRLLDDFEVPDPAARARVQLAHEELRRGWTRGSASL
ncbi:hypothetical protein [Kribbella monticola]|uniref:hypothetical protein n=1 Tax=Kribbella monticola TaxID=2185285 RepID=UPI000DD34D10|nr:hypothetical protein [Kribbella monticola]